MSVFLPNLRDVGGVGAQDGKVRTGRLLRSALPYATDLVPDTITWPPSTVIDLRSTAEFVREPSHPLAGSVPSVLNFPLLSALRPGVVPPSTLAELYQLMLRTTAEHLVNVVDAIAVAPGTTLVHCAVGKDRTGVSVAMVLSLLGVERDAIVHDYLETGRNTADIVARLQLMHVDSSRPTPPAAFLQTPVEAITGVLDLWDAHAGGAVGWFKESGGTDRTVDLLRESMVE